MPVRTVDPYTRSRVKRLLQLNWKPAAVVEAEHVSLATVYNYQRNLSYYGSTLPPAIRTRGAPRRITTAAGEALLAYLQEFPWAYRDEMKEFLWEEEGLEVDASTITRFLQRNKQSYKIGQKISDRQNAFLRNNWQAELLYLRAESLIFIDESLFNQTTGWRKKAWAPIGKPARYHCDIRRGKSWSILPAYTTEGYLPCTGIKEGYYNGEAFLTWIKEELLAFCRPGSVIIMDNNSTHIDPEVAEAINVAGFQLLFLPPYSPDFNPIELTFSVLKAWMKRHFYRLWPSFEGDFGDFLRFAIKQSKCDRFAKEHFRHSAGGYMFEGDYEAFQRELDSLV